MEHDGLLPLNQPKNLENQNFEEKKKNAGGTDNIQK